MTKGDNEGEREGEKVYGCLLVFIWGNQSSTAAGLRMEWRGGGGGADPEWSSASTEAGKRKRER